MIKQKKRFFSVSKYSFRLESVFVLILLAAIMSILSPFFFSVSNFLNILLATSVIGVLAIGATMVISSAGIDLSLGSVMGFSGIVGALVMNQLGLPWYLGVFACLGAGALAGLINGIIIAKAGVPAFIATLGMLGIARGAGLVLSSGKPIYGLPEWFLFLGQGRPLGIPMPIIIFLGVTILFHYILAYTRFGKHTLVLGDNEKASIATGIHVATHRIKLYVCTGALSGLAGMLFTARVNSGDPTAGLNYELTAITASIIGGTNLFGGRGSIIGTLIGALIMGVLQNGLNLLAVQSYYQPMAIGSVLILAVWLDQVNSRKIKK